MNRAITGKVALAQTGVILAGVLAANFGYYAASGIVGFAPGSTAFLAHFGFLLLALPLGWFLVAARLRNGQNSSRLQKGLALGSGIALIVALILFSAFAAGAPWMGSTRWLQDG